MTDKYYVMGNGIVGCIMAHCNLNGDTKKKKDCRI